VFEADTLQPEGSVEGGVGEFSEPYGGRVPNQQMVKACTVAASRTTRMHK